MALFPGFTAPCPVLRRRRFEKEPKDDGKSRGEAMDDFVCKHCS